MRAGLDVLYLGLLRFAERFFHESETSSIGLPVLLHLVNEPVDHLGRYNGVFCNWCYFSSVIACAAVGGAGCFSPWASLGWGGFATC